LTQMGRSANTGIVSVQKLTIDTMMDATETITHGLTTLRV